LIEFDGWSTDRIGIDSPKTVSVLPFVSLAVASEPPFFACATAPRSGANGEAGPKGEREARVKKEWPKESTPRRLRPALRAGSACFAGFFDITSLCWSKNARHPAARPTGLIRESRRNQGPR
jgi:hypothetical protein